MKIAVKIAECVLLLFIICFTAGTTFANTLETAETLALGAPVTDALTSTERTIYYKFVLTAPAYVQVSFQHTSNGSSSNYWRTMVQNADGQITYLYSYIAGNATDTLKKVGLPAGTYLVTVTQGSLFDGRQYTLAVNASNAGAFEQEQNDTVEHPNAVTLGTAYTGNIAGVQSGSDVDYYSFTISEASYVQINFKHDSNGSASTYWYTSVESPDGLKSFLYTNISGNVTDTTKYVGLPAGTYLLKVGQSYADDRDYTLTINASGGTFEREGNDSIDSSTPLPLGTTYQGNIGSRSTDKDVDYYSFTIQQPSYVEVNFTHGSNSIASSYWNATVQSADGLNSVLYMNINGNATTTMKYVGLPAGTYLVKVTQGTKSDDRDYSLTVNAATGNFEKETNGTTDKANQLTLGTPYQGNIAALSSGSDVDYYSFTLAQPGYVEVNFKHASNGSANTYWRTTVESADSLHSYLLINVSGSATDTTKYVGLPAGKYLVKVVQSSFDDRDYSLTVSAKEGAFEKENNNTINSATPVTSGTAVQGNIALLTSGSDVDYYSFTISEASYVRVNFKHVSNGSNSTYWRTSVESADGLKSYLYTSIGGNATDTTKYVGLPAGTYLVKVTQVAFDDRDYTLTINAAGGTFEWESNDTIDSATPIVLGATYQGNVGALSTGKDVDYYSFTIREAGYVQVNFTHSTNSIASSYWNATVQSADGLNSVLDMNINGNATATTKYVGLPAGTYLVKVTQGTSSDDRDYFLTVNAAAGNFEKETNDTKEKANPLTLGTGCQGNIAALASGSDVDYYSFTISEPSYVQVNFRHVSTGTASVFWRTSVESADGFQSYLVTNISGNATDTTRYIGLPAGTYLVKVVQSLLDDRDYTLTVNATAGNYEQEKNDVIGDATPIAFNTQYTGNIATRQSGYDFDYYKFTTYQGGSLRLVFRHDSNGSSGSYWEVAVLTADGQSGYVVAAVAGSLTELSKVVELPSGTYLVRVTQGSYKDERDYAFTLEDITPPTISAFAASQAVSSLTVSIDAFSSTDNIGVTGYRISESNIAPLAADTGWTATPPASFTFGSYGSKTLYAWARDAAGNISAPATTSTTVTGAATVTVMHVGSGAGTVNSDRPGIACAGESSDGCSASFDGGSVLLAATPASTSTFDGWSGACGGKGACTVIMDADKTVIASFTEAPPAMIGTTPYSTLQAAYDNATNGTVIMMREGTLFSPLLAGRNINIRIKGGYNAGYSTVSGHTTIGQRVVVRTGTIKIEGAKLR